MESSRVKSLRAELSKARAEDDLAAWEEERQKIRDRNAAIKLAVQTWETDNHQHKMSLTKIAEEFKNFENDTLNGRIKDNREKDNHPKIIDAKKKIGELQWKIRRLEGMIKEWEHENESDIKQHYLDLIESDLKYIPPYFIVREIMFMNEIGIQAKSLCGCAYYHFQGGNYPIDVHPRYPTLYGHTESHCHIHLCWYHKQKMDLETVCSIFITNVNQQGYNISEHKKHSKGDLDRPEYNKPNNEKYVEACRCHTCLYH